MLDLPTGAYPDKAALIFFGSEMTFYELRQESIRLANALSGLGIQVKDMGIYFSEGYGLSESTSLGISNPVLGLKKVGSIGIPFPDNDVRLVDVDQGETDVPDGQPGEIIMKGPLGVVTN
ncbi:MAG: AMP-binding protein [Smithellaceae bacterium]|nr:AMP-binding protein [Smithellaceae bacterium]